MKNLGFVFILSALMLSSTVVSAQGWRAGRSGGNNFTASQARCVNLVNGLSTQQKEKITQLVNAHQQTMAELRAEQRSTYDTAKKNEIREMMLQNVQSHRNEIRNLLTEEQQGQLDLLQASNQNRGRGNCVSRGGYAGRGGCNRQGFRGGW